MTPTRNIPAVSGRVPSRVPVGSCVSAPVPVSGIGRSATRGHTTDTLRAFSKHSEEL